MISEELDRRIEATLEENRAAVRRAARRIARAKQASERSSIAGDRVLRELRARISR